VRTFQRDPSGAGQAAIRALTIPTGRSLSGMFAGSVCADIRDGRGRTDYARLPHRGQILVGDGPFVANGVADARLGHSVLFLAGEFHDDQSSDDEGAAPREAERSASSVPAPGIVVMTGPVSRMVVVEPTFLVAQTFGLALGGAVDSRAVVVGIDSSVDSTTKDVLAVRPGVVVVDCELGPHVDCATLVETLVEHAMQVIVLTNREDDDVILGECLRRGAVGALHKSDGLAPIIQAVRRALAREPAMGLDVARQLMDVAQCAQESRAVQRRRLSTLSVRERQVLKLLMTGSTAPQIARSWSLSEATVRTQIKSILSKLEVGSQLAAAAAAYQHGWMPSTTHLPMAVGSASR